MGLTALAIFRNSNLKPEDLVGIVLHHGGYSRRITGVKYREGIGGDPDFWQAYYDLGGIGVSPRKYMERLDRLLNRPVKMIYVRGAIHLA